MMSQADLITRIARVQAGEADAWGELYQDLAPTVFRLCRRALKTREDAEDATTEIFLKVRVKLGQYDRHRPFRPWLFKLAANHCWDELRRRQRRREVGDIDSLGAESPEPGPLARLLAEQRRQDVRGALAKLDDRDRLALVMRYYAELSYDEIAEVLGVTSTLVGVLLLRARRRLRHMLIDEGGA
jgi:RNA polymerase sigma-70 factor (ECF subfamily)